jgi:DNA-binding response OmpR family regulator
LTEGQTSILVVEDEPSIAEVVSLYLRRAGFEVQVLSDGKAALASMERLMPDLLILDLMLPGLDGLQITR